MEITSIWTTGFARNYIVWNNFRLLNYKYNYGTLQTTCSYYGRSNIVMDKLRNQSFREESTIGKIVRNLVILALMIVLLIYLKGI